MSCKPSWKDIYNIVVKLRTEKAVRDCWSNSQGPRGVAVSMMTVHRLAFMYGCIHGLDNSFDWMLHVLVMMIIPEPNTSIHTRIIQW